MRHADLFVHGLELNKSEEQYFKAIIKYRSATNPEEIKLLEELVFNLRSKNLGKVEQRYLDSETAPLNNWLFYALMNLPFIDETFTPESVQKIMRQKVSVEEIDQVLNELIRVGIFEKDNCGKIAREEREITTKNDLSISEVHRYYEAVSKLAIESIPVDVLEREFQCFTLPIKKDRLPYFKELLREFRNKLIGECGFQGDDIYQVNLQLFPLTNNQKEDSQAQLSTY